MLSFLYKSFSKWKILSLFSVLLLWPYWWAKPLQPHGDAAHFWYFQEFFSLGLKQGIDSLMYAGPWYIFYNPWYHPDTYIIIIILQIFTYCSFVLALCLIIQKLNYTNITKLVISLSIISILSLSVDARFIVHLLLIPLVYNLLSKNNISFYYIFYLVSASFVGLAKGTFSLMLFPVIIILFLEELNNKNFPWYSILFLLSIFVTGFVSGHSPTDLFNYIHSIISLSSFYGQVFGEYGSIVTYISFIIFSLFFGFMITFTEFKKNKYFISNIIKITCYGLITIVIIGTSFVRQDGEHVVRAIFSLPIFFLLYLITHNLPSTRIFNFHNNKTTKNYFFPIHLLFLFTFSACVAIILIHPSLSSNKINRVKQQIMGFVDISFLNSANTKKRILQSRNLAAEYFPYDTNIINEPLLLYVNNITPVHFSGFDDYEVVPGITSYFSASGIIDKINAEFIKNSDKNYIIYEFPAPITLSLSFLEMISKYKYKDDISKGTYHVLYKRETPLKYELICEETEKIKWDNKTKVNTTKGDFVLLKINLQRTFLDRLLGSIYKPLTVYFTQYSSSQEVNSYQMDDQLAYNGHIVYPFYEDKANFYKITTSPTESIILNNTFFKIHYEKDYIHSMLNVKFFIKEKIVYQLCNGFFKNEF